MKARERALRQWAADQLAIPTDDAGWNGLAGDAGGRQYFRLTRRGRCWICVDSPPETEKNREFVRIRSLLSGAGVRTPEVYAADLGRGFLLVEDLGDELLSSGLSPGNADRRYGLALAMLFDIQGIDPGAGIVPDYDRAVLAEEIGRFPEWFCEGLLELELAASERAVLEAAGERLIGCALAQPRVLVHVDFHSRNLLVLPGGELAVIDFQDARRGPVCYDLAGLLRDCYVAWPQPRVRAWALAYRRRLLEAGRPAADSDEEFLRWFDWVGLHRHIKVLGNFARASIRDGKHAYLKDIPRVLAYIEQALSRHAEFDELLRWFGDRIRPALADAKGAART